MRFEAILFFLLFTSAGAFAQSRLSGNVSGSAYLPAPFAVVPDINGTEHSADFGWPEVDGNVYFRVLEAEGGEKSFLSLYAGGTYRVMHGLEEDSDGREFEDGRLSMRQVRLGIKLFDLVRASYVRAGINGNGYSEGLFETYRYGGPLHWADGYEVGLEAQRDANAVGLYYQSSFGPSSNENERAIKWSTIEARIRSSLLRGESADGFVQLTVGYDLMEYDDREVSDNRAISMNALRFGLGVGVAF